ncbi:hypothetical protein MATL_G00167320 [Megalops atlanticus]|uniref:Centrobin n=1 Tax=Megalops atlanticus TaxID=7932 RepID=A0A9D3PN83_MEGAT|nr:hypothetical protein MATL_G00167320 [Megalops atlanticus]
MSSLKTEDLLSDVEPLPSSAPPSPPPSAFQVTARLYASLQRSRELEVKGYTAADPFPECPDRPRQVTFNLSSPELYSERAASLRPRRGEGWPEDTPPSLPRQTDEQEGVDSSSPASLATCPSPGAGDPGASRTGGAEEGEGEGGLELGQLAEEMSANLQTSVDNTATVPNGRRHILDMENVRSHLKTMLRATHDPMEHEKGATTLTMYTLPERHRKDNESFESDSTAHLLSAPLLADLSPPLPLGGLEELFPRYSRLRPDGAPLSSEAQVLRESLERERARRKQYEKQIQVLQSKALQLQQQLAMAVSADRKKDIMIEQLDKTLAKVVEGWRRHEEEKSAGVRRLQEEKEAAVKAQAAQQEVLLRFEQSLSQAAETLDREQKRTEELRSANQQLERELAELGARLEEETQEGERARAERDEARAEEGHLRTQAQDALASLAQHRDSWTHRERELQAQLEALGAQLDSEKESREREAQRLQEAQRELQEAQGRLRQLEVELEEARRERDGTRMDRALDQARFEAQRSQLEVEFRLSVEQQVTERLAALQEDNAKTTAALREQHRKQLLDLSARHERELSAQLAQFKTELQEREDRLRKLTEEYETKMSARQEEVLCLEASRRKLEAQRTELVTRLQGLMRSHWAEALRLLSTQTQMDGSPSPSQRHASSCEGDMSQSPSGGGGDSGGWESQTRASGGSTGASPASQLASDFPQAVALHLSRERGGPRVGPASHSDGPRAPLAPPHAPEQELSVLLNHSHTFSPLEPQLDDTALTALGSCETEEPSAKPLAGAGDRGYSMERGTQLRGHVTERGHSSDREGRERGGSMGQSAYSSSMERQGPSSYRVDLGLRQGERGYGAPGDGDRGHGGGDSGYSTARGGEAHRVYSTNSGVCLPLSTNGPESGGHWGVGRERVFPAGREHHAAGQDSLGGRGHSMWAGVADRGAGGTRVPQVLNTSVTSIGDASYSSVASSKAKPGGGFPQRPPGDAAQGERPGTKGEDRQRELQYYIEMLLDRSPGQPLESSALDDGHQLSGQSSAHAQTGLGASWGSEKAKPPAGRAVSPIQRPSSAVTKTKLRPVAPGQVSVKEPHPGTLPPEAMAALSPEKLGQLSLLLSQYHAQPERAAPSLEELLTCMLQSHTDRSLPGQGKGEGEGTVHRNQDQKLSQARKETVGSVPQRRSQPPRPLGGEKVQSQAPKGKRVGPQAQRGVWR